VRCRRESLAYYRIANHYKWVFQQLFECFRYERVIVVEDDMLFAPDFFSYFEAASRILDQVWSQDTFGDCANLRTNASALSPSSPHLTLNSSQISRICSCMS